MMQFSSVGGEDREVEESRAENGPGSQDSWAQLQALVAIAGGLVGATAYLYMLGGLVVWLKLKAAQLPTDDAIRALDRNRLLAVGIKAFVFEAALIGGL